MTRRDPTQPPGPQKQQAADPVKAAVLDYGNAVCRSAYELCRREKTVNTFVAEVAAERHKLEQALAALGVHIAASQVKYLNRNILAAAESWAKVDHNSNSARHRWKSVARHIINRATRKRQAAS